MTGREVREDPSGFLTELFHRFVEDHDEGRPVDKEALLREAEARGDGKGRQRLDRRIRSFLEFEASVEALDEGGDPVPERLGKYVVHGVIARGGMSTVYRSRDPELERPVALKVVSVGEARALIRKEARSLARMDQAGVVQVFHVGTAEGRDFLVMEYLPGPSLAEVIRALRHLKEGGDGPERGEADELARSLEPVSSRLAVLLAIVEALAACHDRSLLHRDVKPANILFNAEETPVLIDFGLVHEGDRDDPMGLVTEQLVTTRGYSAPEQLALQRTGTDARSDQFSLGVVAYELLTLRQPFVEEGRLDATANQEARFPAPRTVEPALSRDLERILLKALARDPDERYPDLHALAADLRAVIEHRPISVREPTFAEVLRLWRRRHGRRLVLVSLVLVLVVVGALALRLGDLGARRDELAGRLDAVVAAPGHDAASFAASGLELEAVQDSRRTWAAASLAGFFDAPPVEETVSTWWDQARQALEAEEARTRELGIVFQYRTWEEVVRIGERLCPDGGCEGLERLSLRGRALYPTDVPRSRLRLLQQGVVRAPGRKTPFGIGFVPIGLTEHLRPGLYRLQLLSEDGASVEAETQFSRYGAWPPPLRLTFHPPLREHFGASFVEGATDQTIRLDISNQVLARGPNVRVPSFWITEPIDVATYMEFCEERGMDTTAVLEIVFQWGLDPEDFAPTTHEVAEEFARAVGGRLPSALELEVAVESGVTHRPTTLGELVCDFGLLTEETQTSDSAAVLSIRQIGLEGPGFTGANGFTSTPRNSFFNRGADYLVFRIVFPSGSLELQERVETTD